MRQDYTIEGRFRPDGHKRPFGRGTARLAAFTALGLAAGSLIGAAAILQMDETGAAGSPTELAAVSPDAPAEGPTLEATAETAAATPKIEQPASGDAEVAVAEPTVAPPVGETPMQARQTLTASSDAATLASPATERFGGVTAPATVPAPEAEGPDRASAPGAVVPDPAVSGAAAPVEIAETEAEALAIEERLSAAGAAYFELPPERDDPFVAALSGDVPLPAARTNAWVNMRAGPDNDAEILTVVPFDAQIGAEADCPSWCEVSYEGQRGYIYQSFIRR